MRPMMRSVRALLEGCLNKCGGPNCQRTKRENGLDLMHCARSLAIFILSIAFLTIIYDEYRCKSAVYVSNKSASLGGCLTKDIIVRN